MPVRNTDFGHLRDGFVRAVQARMKTSQLGAEESQVSFHTHTGIHTNTPLKASQRVAADFQVILPPKQGTKRR